MTTIPAFCGDEFIGLEKSPMVSHKFGVGNRVRLTLDRYAESSPWDIHTISRKLPAEANVCQYRVKRVGDGQERTVSEHQMVAVGAEDRAYPHAGARAIARSSACSRCGQATAGICPTIRSRAPLTAAHGW